MKIPYIKLYAADLLAASRNVTSQQLGDAILGVCELAFENTTLYEPQTPREKAVFEMLLNWKKEAKVCVKQKKQAGRLGAEKRWKNQTVLDGSTAISAANNTPNSHTDTETEPDTETETKTENINTLTAQGKPAQTASALLTAKKQRPKTLLQQFSNEVLKNFESTVQTDAQKHIWFKRNCRCLSDILNFCNRDITLAIQTISVCVRGLEKAGLWGGYEAVCRNLPEYMMRAQQELEKLVPAVAPFESANLV